jgi:site-specific DNA-methyltransferase (adenine-specific)
MGATLTAPATDAAKQWAGWGTALKPAWEPIILARKPLVGTVAANVLAHGTGAINVDGCRIGWASDADAAAAATGYAAATARKTVVQSHAIGKESRDGTKHYDPHAVTGRWPANVALDEEAAAMLGEPSRFFYTAKASRRERGEGNTHPTVKPQALMRWLVRMVTPFGGLVLDPFSGSGSTGVASIAEGFQYVGCEREAEYVEISRRRLADAEESQRSLF